MLSVVLDFLAGNFVPALAGGGVSFVVSSYVARQQVKTQMELKNDQRRQEWYERTITLADRTHGDWYDAVASKWSHPETNTRVKFLNRREELREHAARGEGLGVDKGIITDLHQMADNLGHASMRIDSPKKLAEIEKKGLIPTAEAVIEDCKEMRDSLDPGCWNNRIVKIFR